MASLLIRNLDDSLKARLRVRAARKGRSMEAEVREILKRELRKPGASRRSASRRKSAGAAENLVELSRELFGPKHGVELEPHPRVDIREPPDFREW